MKKVTKIITLILVVALLTSVFAGCAMFGRDTAKYRSADILTVGDQSITIGEVLDAFNTQYNNYYYYIAQGYFTAEQVFEMAVSSLYEQAIKVDTYATLNKDTPAQTGAVAYKNGEYLTADELNFVVRYVKYLVFTNFDGQVEEFLKADFTFNAEETEDTSRDFPEADDLEGKVYSAYIYSQNFVNEDMDEYMSERYSHLTKESLQADNSVEGYLFATEAQAEKALEKYNARLDEDATQLDYATLKATQEKVIRLYKTNIKASYGYDLEQFVKNQVESMIKSIIVAKYNYEELYSKLDGADKTRTINALLANTSSLAANQKADYFYNDSFDSFITALTDSSYIYEVDADESDKYVFVKNILIPFSAEQTQELSNLSAIYGGTESKKYLDARTQLVKSIVADDYTSEKDDDGNYTVKESNLFDVDANGKVIVKAGSKLAENLQNGVVTPMEGKDKTETIVELMKKYNTDTASHAKTYDYVVRVGDTTNYTQPWVTEFVDAAKEFYDEATQQVKDDAVGSYSVCVSSYGVHILYCSGKVTKADFSENAFNNVVGSDSADTSSDAYKVFKAYFETESNSIVTEDMEALREAYAENGKVVATKEFAKFMKDNSLEYHIEDLISTDDEEDDSHEGHNH